MRKEFGEKYIEKKIRQMEESLNKKLKVLIEGTRNKYKEKDKEIEFAEKVLNLTETKFTENEHKLLGKMCIRDRAGTCAIQILN